MQGAKTESKNPLDYLRKAMRVLLRTGCVTTFMIVSLVVPLAMMVIGAMFLNQCPIQRIIPIFLIVWGATYIMKNLTDLRFRWKNHDDIDRWQEERITREGVQTIGSRIVGLFLFAFFIAGNVFVYGIYPQVQTTDPKDKEGYCNPILYYFSFWWMTTVYIICALTCCGVCCAIGAAAWRADEEDDEE